MSVWSTATTVTITGYVAETVSTPNVPAGPTTGEEGQSLRYSGSGAESSYGDDIQYRFDWGNDNYSNWTEFVSSDILVSMNHSWKSNFTYNNYFSF